MFKLKILVINFFAQDLAMMFAQYYPKVEFVLPPSEVCGDFKKLETFIRKSDAQVVFLEEEINLYPKTGKDLIEACKGKIMYDSSFFQSLKCHNTPNCPPFQEGNKGWQLLPSIFLHRDGISKVFLMAFIHSLRHFVQAIQEQKKKS